jgi:site-specific DNA-methyltransferase (adenine-specific)
MTFTIHNGNCIDVMRTMPDNSVDAIVTDPPYELGFMGKSWDSTGIAFNVEVWTEALRVLKPGGHLLAFSGSRTYHRMAVAIEDAGFQIRDQIMWIYGSGFPKSLDVSKAIDNKAGSKKADRVVAEAGVSGSHENPTKAILNKGTPITPEAQQWKGWGTALKPAHEPIVLARKPLIGTVAANVLEHGTGGLNIDGSRIPHLDEADRASATPQGRVTSNTMAGAVPDVDDIGRKELDRPDTSKGRFPANLIHDGSDEVGELLGEPARFFYCAKASKRDRNEGLDGFELKPGGSNAKGYTADVAKGLDRNRPVANHHPTVKPTDLMRYLVKLITPPSGIVLDPFTGSGSTGKGAVIEGFNFVGIELDPDYVAIATARIQHQLDKLLTDDATRRYLKADDTNDQLF